MLVDDIDLPQEMLNIFSEMGIRSLYSPQAEAIPHVEEGKNILMAVPTAAGKSLVAYVGVLRGVLRGGKALYIVPLRALAWEKIEELKKFGSAGIRVGVSVGDYDSTPEKLARCDIIVATAEKADSLLRHRAKWLREVSVVVADEVHLIQDAKRGPTMEVILARFKSLPQMIQIIALSATVPNSQEIADWLEAVHLKSDWRPVELRSFVFHGGKQYHASPDDELTMEESGFPSAKKGEESIIRDNLEKGHQCLAFVNARNRAVSLARNMSTLTEKKLSSTEKQDLKDLAGQLLKVERETTEIAKELAGFLEKGSSFHHAGLTDPMRKIIEKGFREGKIKIIAATPTLAAGVNLPARRVIVRDSYRYEGGRGMAPLPVLEVKQMCGRAGRPGYDTEGEAFIIASSHKKVRELVERYLIGEGETIQSKLGLEGALRVHILASIAAGFVTGLDSLEKFIDSTLYAHQSDKYFLKEQISSTIDFLLANGFMKYMDELGDFKTEKLSLYGCKPANDLAVSFENGFENLPMFENALAISASGKEGSEAGSIRFYPTEFGLRTSRLYVDPMSALKLRNALMVLENDPERKIKALGVLHALCSCPDMNPFYLRRAESLTFAELYGKRKEDFLIEAPTELHEFEFFLSEIKTASLLYDWMEELSEDVITKKYNVGPGDIRSRVELGEWLLYSMKELAKLFSSSRVNSIEKMLVRLQQGIKEELAELVSIRDIGRVRGRALYEAGFSDRMKLAKASIDQLVVIRGFGRVLAEKILKEANVIPG